MNTLNEIRASAKQQHGYDVGESGAMVLAVLSGHLNEHRARIEEATARINASTRSFQSNDSKAAFWYGIGRGTPWAVVSLLVAVMLGFFYSKSEKSQKTQWILNRYPNASDYRFLMQDGRTVEQPNGWTELILTLSPRPNETIAGKHYRYDHIKKQVYVPLYYTDSKP